MTTELDKLLISIDPDKSMGETSARIDRGINSFRCPSVIDNWGDFRQCLSRFVCHIEACVLRLRQSMDDHLEHYWDQAFRSMHKIYGPNGEKAAFEMARTGNQGGLYAVLKAVAKQSAEQYTQNEISARVSVYWQELSLEEKLAAPIEYIEKFGHLLPSELTEASAARVRANFPQFLEKHPQMFQKLRHTGL